VATKLRKNGNKQALQCKPKGRRKIGHQKKRRKDQLHLEG
jgi:hypothetical protein